MNEYFHHGFGLTEVALAVQRVALGAFFTISGAHKLFVKERHAKLVANLRENKIPFIPFHEWWVPGWEFFAGFTLVLGFASSFSAAVLAIICIVACFAEARIKVASYKPLNAADALDDYLYLPEVLYVIMLMVIVLGGGGHFSVDNLLKGE